MEAALGILSSQGAGEEDEINRVLEASTTAPQDLHHQQAYKQEEIDVKIENGRACQENDEAKSSSPKHKDLSSSKQISATTNIKGSSMEPDHSVASTSSQKEQDYQIESARAEMGEVREENKRLKKYLDRIMGDYNTLQMQFHDIQQKSAANKSRLQDSTSNVNHQDDEESDLVSLSLGSFSSKRKKVDEKNVKNPSYHQGRENESDKESLSLGLDSCKYEPKSSTPSTEVRLSNPSPASSLEEVPKGEEAGETWPPRKVAKTMRSIEDDIAQQNPLKKARVSVRARCDTPTMNDGCQWRKYGQKIAKGNPCPRAYYRCTIAPSCPVRKQVQRCAEDMSILITTYEGAHNHPLPMAATAMASTTSAAASMLLSGSSSSSSSQSGLMNPASAAATTTTAAGLHGYNFYLSDNSKSRFFIPNSSMSSALPTITLDLTSNPSSSSPSSSHFNNKFSSSHHQIYPPTSLNFGSSDPNTMSWSNGFLSYGNGTTQPYNKNQMVALSSLGRQQPIQNTIYQNYMQKNNNNNNINPITSIPTHHQQQFQADPIAAATKAITADPSFQSALAAALTSIIGNSGGGGSGSTGLVLGNQAAGGDHINHMAQKFKWGEQFPGSSSTTASSYLQTAVHQKGNVGCASSYLNKTTTSSANMSQAGSNLVFSLPPSLPFSSSTPKSASASPGDTRDHNN